MYPKDYRYTKEHEWIRLEGKVGTVGLTDFAQKQLGDIVFVELPEVGKQFAEGDPFGTVESVKSVSELFVPLAGKVTEVNGDLDSEPELINEDAHAAWLIKLDVTDPKAVDGLLTAEQYEAYINE
ncbi:glycine cleavage system protein GcvH [Kitasatospora acidiphila]|uniref:Glycine cleavage system H protein n=1 Tax=Kitasatospora acidiphila TaxID=2567942 RepID=A0A540WC72_9ACTN|nr:glycine cleavage system protein GcvH [Kitasatospora acidiphila]TQF06640.1 glycine cleavage system protein GcvH [Kitasatospora acidiphila]